VIPFHRAVTEDPAFIGESVESFGIFTTWIETEFSATLPPWDGTVSGGVDDIELYRTVVVEVEGRRLKVGVPAGIFAAGESARHGRAPQRLVPEKSGQLGGSNRIVAPMQSTVVKVNVSNNDVVVEGDIICVVEAMKMEQTVTAPHNGVVSEIMIAAGDSLHSGQQIAMVEPAA